jgi:GDP-L-fucose synthase
MFYQDKLVLVTGGSGFVGGHFVDRLLALGARVRIPLHQRPLAIEHERIETLQADLMRQADCLRACEGVDCVVHAAGAVSAAGVTGGPAAMGPITVNLNLSAQMLQAAWTAGVDRFLLFSSSTGYPAADHPVKEEEFWAGPTYPGYFGYGWMRRYLERIGEFTHQRSGTKVAIVRPTAVYGERDDFDPVTSHVIPALIRRAVAGENPFEVWGSPTVVRDFLHVGDLVEGALLLLEKHAEADPVNIGCGEAVTVGEIVDMVLEAAEHDAEVIYDESKPTTIPFRMADIGKARQLLGFEPRISMREGLRRTLDWYKTRQT